MLYLNEDQTPDTGEGGRGLDHWLARIQGLVCSEYCTWDNLGSIARTDPKRRTQLAIVQIPRDHRTQGAEKSSRHHASRK
jgi:hypothetical protein